MSYWKLYYHFVLSRSWEQGRLWKDTDEVINETEPLAKLVGGLLNHCRERIILAMPDLGGSGRGILLRAFQKVPQT